MIKPDINKLPDHSAELKNVLNLSKKSYKKYLEDISLGHVTPLKRKTYKYIFETYLYAVADLSIEVNKLIEDNLKEYYTKTYKGSPALGNKLFYQEYFGLFKEYDLVKRFIWKAIFKVDEEGIVQHDILI